MITRLEATRYRCFERLGIDVGDFRVLVGANGSGKTTLLDLPVLLGDLLRANNVAIPFMERRQELPPRAGSLNELVFAGRGSDFALAVEARLPDVVQSKVLEGMFARKRTERSRQALQEDRRQWPTHIRYEIGLRISSDQALQVAYEYLFLFPESDAPDRRHVIHGGPFQQLEPLVGQRRDDPPPIIGGGAPLDQPCLLHASHGVGQPGARLVRIVGKL